MKSEAKKAKGDIKKPTVSCTEIILYILILCTYSVIQTKVYLLETNGRNLNGKIIGSLYIAI